MNGHAQNSYDDWLHVDFWECGDCQLDTYSNNYKPKFCQHCGAKFAEYFNREGVVEK